MEGREGSLSLTLMDRSTYSSFQQLVSFTFRLSLLTVTTSFRSGVFAVVVVVVAI